jgi:hypothetical protein
MTPTSRLALAAGCLAGLAVIAGAATAQDRGHGSRGIDVVAIDADGDGTLSRAELQARAVERLTRADSNGDGALDRAELIAVMPSPHGGFFDVFGADPAEAMADRTLALMGATETGRVEIVALADRRVNTLLAYVDTDRDAAVSQEEAEAVQSRRGRHDEHGHGGPGDDDDREQRRD